MKKLTKKQIAFNHDISRSIAEYVPSGYGNVLAKKSSKKKLK